MKEKNIFYGWKVTFACLIIGFSVYGIVNNCASLFFKTVSDDLNVSRTGFSMYYTIVCIAIMITAPFVSSVFKKFGAKKIIIIFGTIASLTFAGFSCTSKLYIFYILGAIQGVSLALSTIVPISIIINNWFISKKGLALGIALSGAGLGGLVFNQVANYIIESLGWRQAYFILGILAIVIFIPATLFLLVETPEEKGLRPYGESESVNSEEVEGLTLSEALKTPSFWLLSLGFFLFCIANIGTQMHIPAYLTDVSFTTSFAATIVTLYMAVAVPSRILVGVVYDKLGLKKGIIIGGGIMIACQVILLIVGNASIMSFLFSVLYGYAICLSTVSPPLFAASIFGSKDYGKIFGVLNMFVALGASVGPIVSGAIYDKTGSYNFAWLLYIGLTILMTIMILLSIRLKKNTK